MTIIKHGTPKTLMDEMIAECKSCGCVFTFRSNEATCLGNNGGGTVCFAHCPECDYSGCAFDSGYRDDNLNRRVMEEHAKLRALITASNHP